MSASEIRQAALQLSSQDRADLAQALWESLDAAFFPVSQEYVSMLEQRDRKMSESPASYSTHDEVMAKAKRKAGC